jgi:hypothetical protein
MDAVCATDRTQRLSFSALRKDLGLDGEPHTVPAMEGDAPEIQHFKRHELMRLAILISRPLLSRGTAWTLLHYLRRLEVKQSGSVSYGFWILN